MSEQAGKLHECDLEGLVIQVRPFGVMIYDGRSVVVIRGLPGAAALPAR